MTPIQSVPPGDCTTGASQETDDPPCGAGIPASTFMQSERLWYRAPEPSDVALFTAWRNDTRVRRTTQPRFPITPEIARKWIEAQNPFQRGVANTHATFFYGLKGTTEPIGNAGLFAIDWLSRHAEFGIGIDPRHWNQGYGREVARQMLHYGFRELNLHRVELRVLAGNSGAVKAYLAAGFVLEATKRQAVYFEGQWDDMLVMAALRDEWTA